MKHNKVKILVNTKNCGRNLHITPILLYTEHMIQTLVDYIIAKMQEAQDIGYTDKEMREQIAIDLINIVFGNK